MSQRVIKKIGWLTFLVKKCKYLLLAVLEAPHDGSGVKQVEELAPVDLVEAHQQRQLREAADTGGYRKSHIYRGSMTYFT